jgi:hypothetical protein
MSPDKTASPGADLVFRAGFRAFFVYYAAIFLVVLGPFNPNFPLPLWAGWLIGALLILVVVYSKWGQEYHLSDRGVAKVWKVPARRIEISWQNLGEVVVLRGVTQSLLKVGTLVLRNEAGGPDLIWYGLARPQEVKDLIEARRKS